MTRTIVAALLIAGIAPALAQDDDPPIVARHPSIKHLHFNLAAIQAPAPRVAAPLPPKKPLTSSQAATNPAQILQQFALSDLQAALADAQAQNPPDTLAGMCWQELITVVQSPAVNPLPAGPGAFQLFQKARDLKNLVAAMQSNSGPLQAVNIACAPLVFDTQATLIQLGVISGGIAATAGGLIPGL